ncbi:nuclear protein localization protein 4, putative [Plasmodium sp. gorilla clade G2]|uniref:nuclear protein localization protein 4, putative n=1 Tax=Plasmodium sp. gorilla clade G2 TaxID=880535 RepID=UPI000D212828|nr:nuclear protein localization protein 4, putative [Plasmodium sp. gorilla clade G2]SOV11596.1 nuclear protein localization protein 4, putative [Plasmodium sp. gorilla clade G2]
MSRIIIRLRCDIGLYRIEIENNKQLVDLKKKIEELLSVPIEKQELYLLDSSQVLLNDNYINLIECKIQNGSMIQLKSDIKPSTKKKEENEKKNKENIKNNDENNKDSNDKDVLKKQMDSFGMQNKGIENNNMNKMYDNINNNKNNSNKYDSNKNENNNNGDGKNGESKPNFKSFDYFLKQRGYNTTDLPLNLEYKSVYLCKGRVNKIPLSITLKHQEYRHVDHLELMNVEEVRNFVNYWYTYNNMLEQRMGWMYGYYKEDNHYNLGIRAVCECIYEPPQYCEDNKIHLLQDDFLPTVDVIAERLGLERIGWIFTHLPRQEYLTSDEVVNIAKIQLKNIKKNMHYTNYPISNFITCTISPDPLLSNEPVTNAFMVSDLGMALMRDNLIQENQLDPSHIQLRNPNKNELLPQILEGGKETNKFDTDWFIVRVNESAPKVERSIFKNFHFPRENRQHLQSAFNVKEYFRSNKLHRGTRGNHQCSDFHLILFVAKVLDIETALALCDATLNKKEIDPIIEEMLTSVKI